MRHRTDRTCRRWRRAGLAHGAGAAPPGGTAQRGPAGCGKAGCSRWACGPPARCAASQIRSRPSLGRARRGDRTRASPHPRGHAPGVGRVSLRAGPDRTGDRRQRRVARGDWRLFNRSGIARIWCPSAVCTSPRSPAWRACWPRSCGGARVGAASDWPSARAVAHRGRHGGRLGRVAVLPARGLGVPARRTFFMLATVLAAAMSRLP